MREEDRPAVGISACLLGQPVRYDGGDKRDAWLTGVLGRTVRYVPVCPEVEAGFGVPREPIRLERADDGTTRIRHVESRDDVTARLAAWARERLAQLEELDGYVLKAGSPSCGRKGVPVHDEGGRVVDANAGFFAWALRARWPDLQIVDEEDLQSRQIRDGFRLAILQHFRERRIGGA